MAKIYLINVGANLSHQREARSPIFPDGRFEYVSFPDPERKTVYPAYARRFVRQDVRTTHPDPDWQGRTYGDFCENRRAKALAKVMERDILLFWGLLWPISNRRANIW